jgi:hypothetical protein
MRADEPEIVSAPPGARNPVVTGGHGYMGEDVAELVGDAVWVPVKSCFKIAPLGRGGVHGQFALQLRAPPAIGGRAGRD